MTIEEANQVITQLRKSGMSDEQILFGFYQMFVNEKLTLDGLNGLVNLMGYHLAEDFLKMSPKDQKTKGIKKIK